MHICIRHMEHTCHSYVPVPIVLVLVTFDGEGAIDDGGPRREFVRLLAQQASDNTLLVLTIIAGSL